MAPPRPSPDTLPALTSVRFLAALVVVLHHYVSLLPYPAWLERLAAHGQAGVCFFFLLSGFILAYNYHGWFADGVTRAAGLAFYRARFARVYPMHLVTLLAATPITLVMYGAFAGGPPPSWRFLAGTWLAHATLLQAWVPSPLVQYIWNSASWSISAEFLFYLAFPLVIAAVAPLAGRPRRLLALAGVVWALEVVAAVAVGLVALGDAPWPVNDGHGGVHWVVSAWAPLRLGEFVVGCILGTLFVQERLAPRGVFRFFEDERRRGFALATAAAVAYGLCWLPVAGGPAGFTVWVARHHVLFVPCFAVAILALAHGRTFASPVLERPAMLLLGEASYSLYLLHGLPLLVMGRLLAPVGPTTALFAMLATIAASVACYLAIETPARQWLRSPRPAPPEAEAA